ncbi:unnamed protein product (macronuclear) [Paramecium tetraurelia]|uniref:Sm protein G n=1 Tax=Paramecium tetraurelia TaxID=5888 RepID=A0DCM3_PARTE|nr:uncharacterized protein GSPATT00015669001 [Paramecium tetraurelia]CAK80790.1 unnamed protein product [Paramecium tetraurelia]|eukprot:XP_001448187.1 hypothetical protein (macronuclear) [Paramecium tetraurelia strain d4-2]
MQSQKRGQQHKQGYQADLNKYFGKRLKIKLNAKRTIIGTVIGFDIFMNLDKEQKIKIICIQALSNVTDQLVDIGQAIVRGNSIIMWECLDKVKD